MNREMEPLIHTPGAQYEWNESYYLCFSDKRNRISGMTRLGFKPNKGEDSMFLLIFLPDGSVAAFQGNEKISSYPEKLNACGMTQTRQPDGTWSYKFNGVATIIKDPSDFPRIRDDPSLIMRMAPLKLDIHFAPINETYEYSKYMTPESREIGKKSGDEHWEQIAKINGEVLVGENVYRFSKIIGQRDHTHGVRDWTGIGDWLYYVVWFNEGLAVNTAAIILKDGRLSIGGFVWKDGRNIPIMGMSILDQQFRNGVIPLSSVLELTDADNTKYVLKGKAGPVVPIPFIDEHGEVSILAQSFGEYELNGLEGGYGTYETLRIASRRA